MALIIDMHGERALGEVKGFLLADELVFVHVVQLAPRSRTCMKRWDTSQCHETIVLARNVICPCPYKWESEDTIRIIVPVFVP